MCSFSRHNSRTSSLILRFRAVRSTLVPDAEHSDRRSPTRTGASKGVCGKTNRISVPFFASARPMP